MQNQESIATKALLASTELMDWDSEAISYGKISDVVCELSGAKYVSFNIFDDDGKGFTTKALSGINPKLIKVSTFLGFDVIDKKWPYDPAREAKINNNPITRFASLHELAAGAIPSSVITIIEKTFSMGEVYLFQILRNKKPIGDFTLIFSKGETLQNRDVVALYSNQVGLYIERNRTQEKLKDSEAQYKLIFENSGTSNSIFDKECRLVLQNSLSVKHLGKPASETIGKDVVQLFGPERGAAVKLRMTRVIVEGKSESFDTAFELPSGKKWFHSIYQPILDNNGRTEFVQVISQDVTEKKQHEEAMQNMQKLESLGLLAGGIAHDFNNLLSSIYGSVEMAKIRATDEKSIRFLADALSSMDRARGLTGQLLTFAHGGAPERHVGALFPFVKEAVQFALSGSNISTYFNVPKDLWTANFDKNQIGQIIDNLIINALQAMPNGGLIEVSAKNLFINDKEHSVLTEGNYVKISIKDNGHGIPKETVPKIFDPFFTTKTSGHGLGLATCFSIIKRHGGIIEVESELGKGSAFHILLPASLDTLFSQIETKVEKHVGKGTFLIMDDEPAVLEIIGEMVMSLGYDVVLKEEGREAVDFFSEAMKNNVKIAGMLFDLTIAGGMGGKEAIGEIRKISSTVPVFVASGYSKDAVMANAKAYGFTASICKPFSLENLSAMLNTHLPTVED